MSSFAFAPRHGPVVVDAQITGPARSAKLRLILDTAATTSVVDLSILTNLGFDPGQPVRYTQLVTGSAVGTAPVFAVTRFSTLGQHRFGFHIVGHTLPPAALADGLLGLDFLRDQTLTNDFRTGQISLA
jgi:hypothetical protein